MLYIKWIFVAKLIILYFTEREDGLPTGYKPVQQSIANYSLCLSDNGEGLSVTEKKG